MFLIGKTDFQKHWKKKKLWSGLVNVWACPGSGKKYNKSSILSLWSCFWSRFCVLRHVFSCRFRGCREHPGTNFVRFGSSFEQRSSVFCVVAPWSILAEASSATYVKSNNLDEHNRICKTSNVQNKILKSHTYAWQNGHLKIYWDMWAQSQWHIHPNFRSSSSPSAM